METGIDFLPDRLKTQRARRKSLIRQANLLLLAGATFAAWMYFSDRRVTAAQAELALLEDRSANVGRLLAQEGQLQKEQADLLIKDRIGSRLGSRVGPLDVLAEMERLLPAGVSLATMNLDAVQVTIPAEMVRDRGAAIPASAAPRESTVHRLRLVLTGIAPGDVEVANFIGQMAASPLFEDVSMGYVRSQSLQGHKAREFQISCHVVR
jgi:Tfp pilus assembly protein PilN